MNIAYCQGCKACHSSGECAVTDDVQAIIAAIKTSRLVIVASPSYWGGVTAQLKTFIDRCRPTAILIPRANFPRGLIAGAAVAVRAVAQGRKYAIVETADIFIPS